MIRHRAALVVALTSLATGAGASQQEGHQMGGAATTPAQNAALVSACVTSQQQAATLADGLTRQLEFARQTNAPADMRIAMDGLQAALVEMRTVLRKCDPLQAAAAASDGQGGHSTMNMQQAVGASRTPMMNPGSTTPALGSMGEMDHPKMAMESAAAKPNMPAGPKPAAPMAGMDHSKMAVGSAATKPGTPTGGKSAAPMAGMDHSKMGTGAGAAKPSAPAAKSADPMAGMDHSKMAMGSVAPKAGDHGATSGTAKLPVTMAERVADPACPSNVGQADAATAVYQKKVYYFCSTADRDRFRKDPAAYLKKQPR